MNAENDATPRRTVAAVWRSHAGEIGAIGLALAIKTLVSLAMVACFFHHTTLAHTFDLHGYFEHYLGYADRMESGLNLLHRWYTGTDASSWYLPLVNWDAQHYLLLSDWGYNQDYDKTGGRQFYPLYPILIRAFSVAMPVPVAALLLNYVFVAGICVFLYRLAAHFQCKRPHLAVLVVMSFPTAFFMSAAYSEPLFLFLLMGFVYHLLVTRNRVQLVYLALLPTARGSAVFALGGLVLYAALDYARGRAAAKKLAWKTTRKPKRQQKERSLRNARVAPASFAWRPYAYCIIAFAIGVVAYLAFFQAIVGDAFIGINAQAGYGIGTVHGINNLFNPKIFIGNFFMDNVSFFHSDRATFDSIMLWLMFITVAVFAARREWALLCFYFSILYGHSAMSEGAGSFSRFALQAAPFLALVLAKYARRARQAGLVYALCAVMFAVQLYLAARFSVNIWVA